MVFPFGILFKSILCLIIVSGDRDKTVWRCCAVGSTAESYVVDVITAATTSLVIDMLTLNSIIVTTPVTYLTRLWCKESVDV